MHMVKIYESEKGRLLSYINDEDSKRTQFTQNQKCFGLLKVSDNLGK